MKNRVKQKLLGAALVIIGIITVLITNDLTLSFFIVPLGVGAIFAKEDILG